MDVDYNEYFKAPLDYNPPNDSELDGNSQFPNLNSLDFRNHKSSGSAKMLPFYELLEANEDQTTILLATNSYTHRLWNSTVFGYERFSAIGKPDESCITLSFEANLTGIRFIEKSMVLFTTANGTIQLWSTHSEIRKKNGYNLFLVSRKSEHFGSITGFCALNKQLAVTGAMDGCVKVWAIAPCDLVSERTYRFAHKEVITDVSNRPDSNDMFATCSRDRTLSIWDKRSNFPIVGSCQNEDYANTACLWTKTNGAEKIYLGDDTGTVYTYDPRTLNQVLTTQKMFDRPVYRFKLNPDGKLLCVLGQTNTLKVINTTPEAETVYTDSTAGDYVRDVCWVNRKDQTQQSFCAVGWNNNIAQHTIK